MDNIKKCSNNFLIDNFLIIIEELNFDDGISGNFTEGEDCLGNLWIQVEFDNSWVLIADSDGRFNILDPLEYKNKHFVSFNLGELSVHMKKKGIKKDKQCKYEDAELYIIDFAKYKTS